MGPPSIGRGRAGRVPERGQEATGFALLNPALYAVVAANSPAGRSSTAQGLFGAAGTVGFVVAPLIAGVLADTDIVYPMYVFSAVLTVTLVLGLAIGGQRLDGRMAAARMATPGAYELEGPGTDGSAR